MRIIDKVSARKSRELYWQRKMSSPEIAKIYHCHQTTIRRRLKRYGIRIRTKSEARINYGGVKIAKEQLKKLYLDKKMTAFEISKKFHCCQRTVLNKLLEYGIPIRTISEANVLKPPRYFRKDFSENLEEKAYLIGFRLGDLTAEEWVKNSPTIYVRASSTKPIFIKLVERLFSSYGHVWRSNRPSRSGNLNVKCYLNRSFDFLLKKQDLIEPWALNNKKYFAAFLAGYTDAEGCFRVDKNTERGYFCISSQDKNILFQIYKKLNELGVLCRPPRLKRKEGIVYRGIKNNKDEWTLSIGRKDALLKLIELISPYLKHAERRKKMMAVKENILWRNKKYNYCRSYRWDKLYLKDSSKLCQVTVMPAL
jgi:intein-encoded DNA endonuclease-like protein